jgi:hypothetical protein
MLKLSTKDKKILKWVVGVTTLAILLVFLTTEPVRARPECALPTTLQKLVEQTTKISVSSPVIYTIPEFKEMMRWYLKKYQGSRDLPWSLEGAKHFLLSELAKPLQFQRGFIAPPGSYFASLLYDNGCAHGWPIDAKIYNEWIKYQKGTNADAS